MKRVLLLNNNFEVLNFINWKRAMKLLYKEKADVVSAWADVRIKFGNDNVNFPAIVRLKYYINKKFGQLLFSRKAVFRRDGLKCQYCSVNLQSNQATMDHIIPKCIGGASSFTNCVTACYPCNNKKGNRTLEDANMRLIRKPIAPIGYCYSMSENERWHPDWNIFFGQEMKFEFKKI